MTAKTTLRVTLPNGHVITRTTARTYTHVVIAAVQNHFDWDADAVKGQSNGVVLGWCGSLALAHKLAAKESGVRIFRRGEEKYRNGRNVGTPTGPMLFEGVSIVPVDV
jgi:hypothetical protein